MDKYADGRIFTGETAVRVGFADKVGGYSVALKSAARLGGLDVEDPKIFTPPPEKEELIKTLLESKSPTAQTIDLLKPKLYGKPLYLMPGTF